MVVHLQRRSIRGKDDLKLIKGIQLYSYSNICILAKHLTAMAPATPLQNATTDPVWQVGAALQGKTSRIFHQNQNVAIVRSFLVLESAVCSSLRKAAL